jgi:predicted  nucleic acid-binding Zn-ribbon protein
MSSASSDFLAPATSAIANTTLSHPPRAACSRLIHEGQLSVKKVASNRFISGSVWKKRYCVLNEFTTNTRKEKPSSSNANVITSSAINEHTIAGSEMDLPVGQGAVRPLNPDVLGELLIYKLPKRPSGPDDVLHDSITIRDSTLLVKETSKLPILHIVTQDGHDMATKSLQFDNAADLDSWVKGIQGMIDGLSADSDNVTDEPSTFATPFESTATAFSGAGTGLRPGGTSGEVDSASSKPSARPLSEGDKRNGAASPARLVSLAADIRSLSNRDGATLGVQSKPTSPSSNRKKSNASASSADAVAERKESERSNNNILKNSTPSMSGELGSANRAMRSLSAASDDSSAYRDYCDFDSSGASAWGIAAVADANRSEVRHASMFSTPVAAVEAIAMVPGGSSFGRDIPSSDSRPSRRGGPRSRGEIDMVVSSIARDNTDSAVIGEPGVIDAKSTRRGPSLRRGSNGNAVNTGKLAVAAKINTGGISTPGSAIPTLDSKLISSNDLRDTSSASDDMGISSPLFAASTPTVPTAADRLDVPALAAPRVDPGPHETPRVPLLGRLNVAGPDGLGISTEFGANSGGRLPVQNTSPADHSAIDMTRKKAEVGSTGVSPFDGFANTTLDSNPFPAIVTWSGHVKIGNNMPPAPSNASVPEPNPSQDEYSLYALELDALKQMNGELNDALLVQEKKFALETSNMSSKLRILSENEALLKAKCDGLERERAEWLATKALLSKQVIDLTGDAEKLRRENAGAVSGPAAAQVDSEHASVVRTLNAELTAARSETGRLKAELDEERVKCVALESKSVTIEETLRMREEELRDAELAVSDYKNQLDELRQRLRGSLSSKLDLQSRLSAEMHEELKGDTARMLSVEKEKAGLEASLAICRDELHILSKDNEDLRAKLTLKEMYVTALSKESQEGKIKYLEDELAHLRQEMPNIEAHKRRLADELGASQQSLFDERSKLLSLNEDCISLRSQLRQKESELSIVESDASNRTRHLTSEITRLVSR